MALFGSGAHTIALSCFLLVVSVILLWKGSAYLVDSASRIAAKFGVSDLAIGLTVVAFGTSAPEMVVTLNAAVTGKPDISVGNIVGSNIFNLGFILGSVAVIRSVPATKRLLYRDCGFMLFVSLGLLFFFRDLLLSRMEGGILISLLACYLFVLFIKKDRDMEAAVSEPAAIKDWILLPLSIGAVAAGGNLLVSSAGFLARSAGISEWTIGLTVVAAGTSAPEMATSITAAVRGKHGISAGNLVGSNIFNFLGVLGLTSLIRPLQIDPGAFASLLMLNGLILLVIVFFRTGWKVSRLEGAVLITASVAMWIADFLK